jgi:hypothetical protein
VADARCVEDGLKMRWSPGWAVVVDESGENADRRRAVGRLMMCGRQQVGRRSEGLLEGCCVRASDQLVDSPLGFESAQGPVRGRFT